MSEETSPQTEYSDAKILEKLNGQTIHFLNGSKMTIKGDKYEFGKTPGTHITRDIILNSVEMGLLSRIYVLEQFITKLLETKENPNAIPAVMTVEEVEQKAKELIHSAFMNNIALRIDSTPLYPYAMRNNVMRLEVWDRNYRNPEETRKPAGFDVD